MECNGYKYSKHAILRMAERDIRPFEVKFCLANGETIASYPNAKPFPAFLFLVHLNQRNLHVCVSKDENGACIIITVYIPDENEWDIDFKTKKQI